MVIELRKKNLLLIGILFGSFAEGKFHHRSDIDLAIYLAPMPEKQKIELTDRILMSTERQINILYLDDPEESPFIIQEALKGIHLVEPDWQTYYDVAHRALHEAESIRFKRTWGEYKDKETHVNIIS